MRKMLVLGLARSGRAAQAVLERHGVEVVGADRTLGNDTDLSMLDGAEVLVKSPGVPGEAPLVAAARERGIPVWSEVELASRYLENPIVGVTGTNGKTTTTELLGAMLGARTAGNVGTALSELVGEVAPDEWVVCELSSFQLEDVHTFRPRIAVLLNLEPDHLDRHGTFEAYRAAKLRVFENQTAEDVAVVPRGFGPVPGEARRVEFGADDDLPAEQLIPGAHNRENAAAATAAARAAGLADDAIAEALRTFPGVPHRLELVAEIDGVRYVNDSKATNTAAARRALTAYAAPLHLILGGSLKGEQFGEFAEDVAVVPRGFGPVPGEARRVEFGADDDLPAEPLIPGAHNRENAAAATAAARAAGLADDQIAEALRAFPGVPHRLELIAEIDGVRYVNDSKATNTAAARRALTAYTAPLHLILGGSLKGEQFDEFAEDVARADVTTAYLIGAAAEPLSEALGYAGVPFLLATTLDRAVAEAASAARPGEVVLLSPACASYDQFRDFEHRGEEFRRLVENLQG